MNVVFKHQLEGFAIVEVEVVAAYKLGENAVVKGTLEGEFYNAGEKAGVER